MLDVVNPLAGVVNWFRKAIPNPVSKNFHTQVGVHLEEVKEMLDAFTVHDVETFNLMNDAKVALCRLSDHLKANDNTLILHVGDRVEFLDAICDQIVTAAGCAYMRDMDVVGGLDEVNRSNHSKFDELGNPIFDDNRKIKKGPNYSPADLKPFV